VWPEANLLCSLDRTWLHFGARLSIRKSSPFINRGQVQQKRKLHEKRNCREIPKKLTKYYESKGQTVSKGTIKYILLHHKAYIYIYIKFNDSDFTCTWVDTGRPLADAVTAYLVGPTVLVALITPDLTGGVVAVGGDGVAAVQTACTDAGAVQKWTPFD